MRIEWNTNGKCNQVKIVNSNQRWKIISDSNFIAIGSYAGQSAHLIFNRLQT
jgi:hypothetical protein